MREDRDRPRPPRYWQDETSGVLRESIRKYLEGESLTPQDIARLRAYFKQWVDSPVWDENPHATSESRNILAGLRTSVEWIKTGTDIRNWLNAAIGFGLDPL